MLRMKRGYSDYAVVEEWEADVAIIGAGAGGAATATALSEAGLRVIVLEAGSHWAPSDFKQDSVWALRNLYQKPWHSDDSWHCIIPVPGGRGWVGAPSSTVRSAFGRQTKSSMTGSAHMAAHVSPKRRWGRSSIGSGARSA